MSKAEATYTNTWNVTRKMYQTSSCYYTSHGERNMQYQAMANHPLIH